MTIDCVAMVKAQLSIDYLIVFSFVLVMFVLIFGIVAVQSVQSSQQRDYAQLQVVAQTIAQDINTASGAGNGYAQNVSLPVGIALTGYNLSITSEGTIIVYDNSTGRLAYVYAYASGSRIISSPQYVSPNAPHTYVIPTASGLIYLQNSHGDICIDYVCNTTSTQAYGLSVYTKSTHTADINGQNSYVYVPNSISLLSPFNANSITMSAWVYFNKFPSGSGLMSIANYGTSGTGSYCFGPQIYVSNNAIYGGFQNLNQGSSDASLPIKIGEWYFVAWTYSQASSQLALYVNNRKTVVNAVVPLDTPDEVYDFIIGSSAYTYNSGQGSCNAAVVPLNGSVSNIQIYSTALSANQIYYLENGGINGGPVQSQNLSGWWPLNGNANDYSGNNNNGRANAVVYPAVAQIYANVTNATLSPVKGDLIGFSSTLGAFQGGGQSALNFTNSNGIATAFLMQTNNTGYATVKVTPFEGNVYTVSNLSDWWPLNENQGNVLFNLANNSAPGRIDNGYWNNVNYVGSFSGQDSYVDIPNSTTTNLYQSPVSISFWVYPKQADKLESVVFKPGAFAACIGAENVIFQDGIGGYFETNYNFSDNTWYNILVTTGSGASGGIYVDGGYVPLRFFTSWGGSANALDMVIGSNQSSSAKSCTGATGSFDGKIANVQINKYNISKEQAALIYSEGISGSPLPSVDNNGWWPLNGNLNDYSGNGNDGFGAGSFSFSPISTQEQGSSNPESFLATGFGGHVIKSYVEVNTINNYAAILTSDSFTITAWIYLNPQCYAKEVVAGDLSGLGSGTGLQLRGGCTVGDSPLIYVSGNPIGSVNYDRIPINKWVMLTAEYNGSTGQATEYLNNATIASGNVGSGLNLAQTFPFEIGSAYQPITKNFFNGSIANVQLYSTALPKSDISFLYNSGFYGMPRPNDGLVAWWPLNGNANDYSGNNNNGIMINTTYEYTVNPSAVPELNGYGISSLNTGDTAIANTHDYNHFSIAAWAYLDQPVPGYGYYLGTTGNGFDLFRNSTAQGVLVGSSEAISNNITTFPVGKWTYVVGTYNGNTISYYADGILLAKEAAAPSVGQSQLNIGENLAGSLANVEYYNISLTAGQVYQLYNNQLPKTYTEQIPLSWGT